VNEVLAFYKYPEPNGREYFKDDFTNPNTVVEVFDYCQILLAYITKAGWKFLVDHYGYEKMFELNITSGWIDCNSLSEYKAAVGSLKHIAFAAVSTHNA